MVNISIAMVGYWMDLDGIFLFIIKYAQVYAQ